VNKSASIRGFLAVSFAALLGASSPAHGDTETLELKLADGRFQPEELVVPADTPFVVRVTNASDAAIEFESFELHRERVVQPGETILVRFPGVSAGSYGFFDDFHTSVPRGSIVVR
jgi:hypothetical protein